MRRRIAARAAPHQAARARRTPRRDARAAAPLRQAPARRSRAREGVALSCSRALSCDVRRELGCGCVPLALHWSEGQLSISLSLYRSDRTEPRVPRDANVNKVNRQKAKSEATFMWVRECLLGTRQKGGTLVAACSSSCLSLECQNHGRMGGAILSPPFPPLWPCYECQIDVWMGAAILSPQFRHLRPSWPC